MEILKRARSQKSLIFFRNGFEKSFLLMIMSLLYTHPLIDICIKRKIFTFSTSLN